MTDPFVSVSVLAAVAAAAVVRALFLIASRYSAVDHHYWVLAAQAYRTRDRLPVRIRGKYLLEDERQAYPPAFGAFLALFPERFLLSRQSAWLVVAVDAVTLACVLAAGAAFALPGQGAAAIVIVLGFAPVLAAYNTQITSRGLGNLALVSMLLLQAAASAVGSAGGAALWTLSVVASAAVILTHKMTTQFMLALWLPWSLALQSHVALLVPPAGLLLATLITGPAFQLLQWRAHAEIISFWYRNWRFLGAHQFRDSPLYGMARPPSPTTFYRAGFAGLVRNVVLAFGYLPSAWLAPLTLAFAPAPPAWLSGWLMTALALCCLSLLVPVFRCIGPGHYYLFNAAPPSALWWGMLVSTETGGPVTAVFGLAMVLTAAFLAAGWLRRASRSQQDDIMPLIARLRAAPPQRVAVFPVTAAERVALETPHAVFWGGHGLGFPQLEPYFPIFRSPVGEAMRRFDITLVAILASWWPEGRFVVPREIGCDEPEQIGAWVLFSVRQPAAPVAGPDQQAGSDERGSI